MLEDINSLHKYTVRIIGNNQEIADTLKKHTKYTKYIQLQGCTLRISYSPILINGFTIAQCPNVWQSVVRVEKGANCPTSSIPPNISVDARDQYYTYYGWNYPTVKHLAEHVMETFDVEELVLPEYFKH